MFSGRSPATNKQQSVAASHDKHHPEKCGYLLFKINALRYGDEKDEPRQEAGLKDVEFHISRNAAALIQLLREKMPQTFTAMRKMGAKMTL